MLECASGRGCTRYCHLHLEREGSLGTRTRVWYEVLCSTALCRAVESTVQFPLPHAACRLRLVPLSSSRRWSTTLSWFGISHRC